jgi:Rap1a immunity proteins
MRVTLLAASLLISATAQAQQPAQQTPEPQHPGWTQRSSHELAADCHSTDAARRQFCVGYVTGIYDLQFAPNPPNGICPPANLNPDLLAEVVTAYLDTHDEGPAPPAIGQAIVRFFPCLPSQERPQERRR